jgi:hypothetical protein
MISWKIFRGVQNNIDFSIFLLLSSLCTFSMPPLCNSNTDYRLKNVSLRISHWNNPDSGWNSLVHHKDHWEEHSGSSLYLRYVPLYVKIKERRKENILKTITVFIFHYERTEILHREGEKMIPWKKIRGGLNNIDLSNFLPLSSLCTFSMPPLCNSNTDYRLKNVSLRISHWKTTQIQVVYLSTP